MSLCHCLACQRRTGSAFAAQAWFAASAVRVEGSSSSYVRVGDSGGRVRFHFCAACGATVHFGRDGEQDRVAVPVGAFAEPGFPAPSLSGHERQMHPWVGLLADMDHKA